MPYGVTDRTIAAVVQKRLRPYRVFVHNHLIRLVVRITLDTLVDRSWMRLNVKFLEAYQGGKHRHKIPRRVYDRLRVAYSEPVMRERGLRFWGPLRRFRPLDKFTPDETAAMLMLRSDCHAARNRPAVTAIDKALAFHRE